MRFLADENFPLDIVIQLRLLGHDVSAICETRPASSDEEVLEMCMTSSRTLLTFDKDFGELAYRHKLPSTCGVILFRLGAAPLHELVRVATAALASQPDWRGLFTVVSSRAIRSRSLL